jgi:Fe-S cluster assembly protein SufB
MPAIKETVETVRSIDVSEYKYGFVTEIESELAPKGLNEDIVRYISAKKGEPEWLLAWRLDAFQRWKTMQEPTWARVNYPSIDYQDLHYYAAPKKTAGPKSLDEVDPELLKTYEKLGIPLREVELLEGVQQSKVAVDAVFDSVSVVTTFKEELAKAGVIFCSISEAVREHPELCGNISARSCRPPTTSSRRSTAPSFPMAASSTSPRACAARWSFPLISASTSRRRDSSSAPSSSRMRAAM